MAFNCQSSCELITQLHNQYVTLFDSYFLPQGIALNISLQRFAGQYTLWIICVDDLAFTILKKLNLANVRLLKLVDLETNELRLAKKNRNSREYFWTLTPFLAKFIFDLNPSFDKIIYVDADMWLFSDPSSIITEFIESGKDVLITKHAYASEYDQSLVSGLFCVQYLIFKNNSRAELVRKEWELECLEWCYQEPEADRFGDQKYLDKWPTIHRDFVHVLGNLPAMQGPWNTIQFPYQKAIFHHFHGFRIGKDFTYRLSTDYVIPTQTIQNIYEPYFLDIVSAIKLLRQHGFQYKEQFINKNPGLFSIFSNKAAIATATLPNKPVHVLNISIGDNRGGASRSAYALTKAINESSENFISTMLVKNKITSDPFVFNSLSVVGNLRFYVLNTLEDLLRKFFKKDGNYRSFGLASAGITKLINDLKPDIIHLHWICGLLSIRDISKINKPIVWTLHDAWPILGTKHLLVEDKIESFTTNEQSHKLSLTDYIIISLKKRYWKNKGIIFISPSQWLSRNIVNHSFILNNSLDVIPNIINTNKDWFEVPKDEARISLNLPLNKKIILYSAEHGATDANKGLSLFIDAINIYTKKYLLNDELIVLLIGNSLSQFRQRFDSKVSLHFLEITNESAILRARYSAADTCVVPSKIENLSNTILESLACNTPLVACDVGGNSEIITHKRNGWLTSTCDANDISDGIYWALNEYQPHQGCISNPKVFSEKFNPILNLSKHLSIYKKMLTT